MAKKAIYLNNATTSWPKPKKVTDRIRSSLECMPDDGGRVSGACERETIADARKSICGHFKVADPGHIVFTQNATDSLNSLIHGFALARGEGFHAVTTELEHNSVLRPLNTLEAAGKITLSRIECDTGGYVGLDAVKESVTEDTALFVMTHGSNVLGTVQDIRKIGRYLKESGIYFIVDGAQTAGHVECDLQKLNADAFAFTGHKGLFGLPGIGGFHVMDPSRISPLRQGGTGLGSELPLQPEHMPQKFECGTPNSLGIASLHAGVEFVEEAGLANIEKKTMDMTRIILEGLGGIDGVRIYSGKPDLPIVSFNIDGAAADDAGYILARSHKIVCRAGLHCAPLVHEKLTGSRGCIRFSLSYMNTKDECEAAVAAVEEVAGGFRG
jgi:cysteine desulfurase family protein